MPRTILHRVTIPLFFVSLIFITNTGFSQQLVYKFKQFTTNEGLPSSEVHQVLRDSRNFMWFATDHGVCRYDGYKFETFNLPDNSILSMYEDVKKRIWFVSFSGQLFYYEDGKFDDYKYNDIIIKMIEQAAINRICIDSADNVYISTTGPNCFLINMKGEVIRLFHPNRTFIWEGFETDNGKYFSYMSGGIMSRDRIYFPFSTYLFSINIKTKTRSYQFRCPGYLNGRKNGIKKLNDGCLVCFNGEFLLKIFPSGKYVLKKMKYSILDIEELNKDRLLVATIQNGLFVLNRNNDVVDHYFQKLTVTGMTKDYEGGLWVSTTQAGAFYLNSLELKHLSEKGVTIDQKILCLEIANDSSIWAGGESGSILKFKVSKRLNYYSFPIVSVNGIHTGTIRNTILVCSGDFIKNNVRRLFSYKKDGINFTLVQSISDLIYFNEKIYSGNPNGVIKMNFKDKTIEFVNKTNFRVSNLYLDSKKSILAGNLFGLWRYVDGELRPYDSTKKALSSRVTDIKEYRNNLLVGTRGKGFLILLKDSLYQITSEDGLASDNIRKIFIDENVIWVGTNKGLSRLLIKSLDPFKYAIINISAQDGLLSNEVNDIKRLDSNIIVATNGGISLFSRNLLLEKKQVPLSLYLTGIKINGKDTAINTQLAFNYKYQNLSLSFVALSYRESSNLEYRYRLLGIDSNWINISGKEIQLNPIPYGQYTVQIESRRQGENWVYKNILEVNIIRKLPFWKTTWFLVGCFLVAAFLMFMFFSNRTQKIKQREKEKTFLNKKLAEMELKALRAQMNPHFIFNVLNSIQYYIMHNKNEEAQHYMSKFAKLIRLTLDNSRSTFISLADELSLLGLYIDLEKIRFEDRFDYDIKIKNDIDLTSVKIPNMLLQPYVENSIKHGFKEKDVKYFLDISLFRENNNIVCVIMDNGIGRAKASLIPAADKDEHLSTGTIIINEKIEALRQYYNYDLSSATEDLLDEKGNDLGTKVILTFPAKTDLLNIV